jgi:hypothetical protein
MSNGQTQNDKLAVITELAKQAPRLGGRARRRTNCF